MCVDFYTSSVLMDDTKPIRDLTGRSSPANSGEPTLRNASPPRSFLDSQGRYVQLDLGRGLDPSTVDALVDMYDQWELSDRASGLPPIGRNCIRDWVQQLRTGIRAIARHDGRIVGHAVLIKCADEQAYELAIFVLGNYQDARIGTRLLDGLLWDAERRGVPAVTLLVEQHNRPARKLYRSMGFEAERDAQTELKMRLEL